jgi:hypothetical protein
LLALAELFHLRPDLPKGLIVGLEPLGYCWRTLK